MRLKWYFISQISHQVQRVVTKKGLNFLKEVIFGTYSNEGLQYIMCDEVYWCDCSPVLADAWCDESVGKWYHGYILAVSTGVIPFCCWIFGDWWDAEVELNGG